MWFKTIFSRKNKSATAPLFDEAFLHRLERMSFQAQRTLRGRPVSGEHRSRNQLPTTIFSDHRPYSPGDDYRYVDWNAFAHHEEIVIKLGEIEQSIGVHILLDISRSMAWGQPPKIRSAQQLVAALGYLALSHHDRLNVVPFNTRALAAFGPTHGKGRLIDMLRFIEQLQPQHTTALARVLPNYASTQLQGGLLVICSDLLDAAGLETALRSFMPPRWQVLVLHILDQRELRPDISGPIELEDAETGQRLDITVDAALLEQYRRNINAWQTQIAATCARRGSIYAPVQTHWPIEQQVVPYLRARRILQ